MDTNKSFSRSSYIHADRSDFLIRILVCKISWPHPHKPKEIWEEVESLEAGADSQVIEESINRLLKNKQYFLSCLKCKKVLPLGHMHDDNHCHVCAEKFLGVVH